MVCIFTQSASLLEGRKGVMKSFALRHMIGQKLKIQAQGLRCWDQMYDRYKNIVNLGI